MTASSAYAAPAYALEAVIGRLLVAGTWLAMGLVAIGVVLMLANGVDPLAHGAIPPFDLATIPTDLAAFRPEGFLWAGIVLVIGLRSGGSRSPASASSRRATGASC